MEDTVPVSDDVRKLAELTGRDILEFINGGEDFELLVTGDYQAVGRARCAMEQDPSQPKVSIIGEILDRPFGIHLARPDGSVINPSMLGWDHFRKREKPDV